MKLATPFSVMGMHRAAKRAPIVVRAVAFVAMSSLLLVLTPCCEAVAAPVGIVPAGAHPRDAAGDHHAHPRDHGAPVMPDPCPVWLDSQFHALATATGALNPGPELHPLPPVPAVLLMSPNAPVALSPHSRSVHSPPSATLPLYLRTKRLLI